MFYLLCIFSQGACFSLCKIAICFTKSRSKSGKPSRDKMLYIESATWETFLKLWGFFVDIQKCKRNIFLQTQKPTTSLGNKALQI